MANETVTLWSLLEQKQLAVLAAEVGENSGTLIRVLETPSLPPFPVWPLPIPVLLASGVAGFVAGLGAGLLSPTRLRA